MNIEYQNRNGLEIAVVSSDTREISSVRDALDLAMSVQYEKGVCRLAFE